MKKSICLKFIVGGLSTWLSMTVGLGLTSAQDSATTLDESTSQALAANSDDEFEPEPALGADDFLEGDVPDWLESYGYEDTHDDPLGGRGVSAVAGSSDSRHCECLWCRDRLTGDWCGFRSGLQQKGILYRGRITQFGMGVGGGVVPPVAPPFAARGIGGGDTFEYTGNSRHDFLVDLDKYGGLPHSKFVVTLENVWGRYGNVSLETGAFSAPVFNSLMPVDLEANGVPRCTNFMLIQPLSEQFVVTVGKTRTIGLADNNKFAGGDGSDQFLNQTFIGSPLMFPNIPFSTFVVGAVMPQEWGNISLSVLDAEDRSTDFMEFGNLYSQGAIVFGQVQVDTNFLDLPGEQHIGGFHKNSDQIDLRFTPLPPTYPYEPGGQGFQNRSESNVIFYGFDQYLITYGPPNARGDTEGWGLFGRASIADEGRGNPNWGAWHASLGFGGDSPLARRRGKGDRFGVGYAYTAASTEFGPIPQALFAPRDAQNIELFYRYQLTRAIQLTPDVQWVKGMLGGLTNDGDAIVAGVRLNIVL